MSCDHGSKPSRISLTDLDLLIQWVFILQCDDDPPHAYSQVFVLKPLGNSYFCQHDMFRLNIHDTA